jgi:hypothetical protein
LNGSGTRCGSQVGESPFPAQFQYIRGDGLNRTDGAMRRGASKGSGGGTDRAAALTARKRWSDLTAARPGGSKGDRIARTGPTVAATAHQRRVCRFGQSRLRLAAPGACRRGGVAGITPLEWGAGAHGLQRGESPFPYGRPTLENASIDKLDKGLFDEPAQRRRVSVSAAAIAL